MSAEGRGGDDLSARQLRRHQVHLRDGDLVLRPLTEDDWPLLFAWNNDPEVLYYAETDDVTGRLLDELQAIYRTVSRTALMFVMEVAGCPIGECWLQEMNLDRVRVRFPDLDCRRIDLTIGDKSLWGQGVGPRAVRLLTRLAFDLGADAVFAVDVADYNPRSRRAFEKVGFRVFETIDVPQPTKAHHVHDLALTCGMWSRGAIATDQEVLRMRVLSAARDVDFLPKPNELRLVLSDTLPPIERVTAAFALAFVDDRLLMTKLRDPARGWDIPGGRLEPGETPEEAMRREVYEEAGARLGPVRLFTCLEMRLLGAKPKGYAFPYPDSYMVFYRARVISLDPFSANEETEGRGLLPPDEARATVWVRRNREFYEAALADAEA